MCLESRTPTPHHHPPPLHTQPYPSFSTLGVKDLPDKIFKTLLFIPPFSNVLVRVRATSTVIRGTKQISVHSPRSIFEWVAFSRAHTPPPPPTPWRGSAHITVFFAPLHLSLSLSLAKPPSTMHNPIWNSAPGLVIARRFYESVPLDLATIKKDVKNYIYKN